MVIIKTAREISLMKDACRISANALRLAGEYVKPGITTWEIDEKVREYIEKQGATPSFLGYGGFPASAGISVNDVVIHGIPSKEQVLKEGDIVSVDVGACYNGYHGDNAYTFACGKISDAAKDLMDATRIGLDKGIEAALAQNRVGDIGSGVLKDRKRLAEDGIVVISAAIDSQSGELINGPEVITKGFVYVKGSEEILEGAVRAAEDAIYYCCDNDIYDLNAIKSKTRDAVLRYVSEKTKRNPMVLPMILEV